MAYPAQLWQDVRKINDADKAISDAIKAWRIKREITQEELGLRIGVTFQQIQKYEGAKNRVSAGRLWRIAKALDVPVNRFFEECPQ